MEKIIFVTDLSPHSSPVREDQLQVALETEHLIDDWSSVEGSDFTLILSSHGSLT